MTAALLATPPAHRSSPPIVHGSMSDAQSLETTTMGGTEVVRWVLWLGIPFAASAAFFAAAIGSGAMWLMGFAWGLGPELMILTCIYLSLTSDSNTELQEAQGASDDVVLNTDRVQAKEAAAMVARAAA